MKDVMATLRDSARLESAPVFEDAVARWRMHKRLLREASRDRRCEFDQYMMASGDGYCLEDSAVFEQKLAAAMLGVSARRTAQSGHETRAGTD